MALTLSSLRPAYSLGTWLNAMAMAGLPAYAADRTIEGTLLTENEGSGYPKIEGTLLTEIENDSVLDSDDISAEISDIFATLELATGIYLNRNLSLQSLIVFESTLDPLPFQDRFFEDHGAYFEELYLQIEGEMLRIFAGKFDASFGTAWNATPGIYGVDFAEDYELAERIGGGVSFSFESMNFGSHTLTANFFFLDTTRLSKSTFTNRGRTRLADGGASNTERLDSVSVTLDSGDFPGVEGLSTHIGYVHQAAGIDGVDDENGVVGGIQKDFEFANGTALFALVEGAYFDNFGGTTANNTYLTGGLQYVFGQWNIALASTARWIEPVGTATVNDHIIQISGGYEIQQGLFAGTGIDAGVAFVEDGGINSTIFGILISREIEFDLAAR